MREIVFMQIGHCGNKVGQKFWEQVSNEHCLDSEGHFCGDNTIPRQRIDVYYEMGAHDTYTPRSIFIDLEPGTLRSLQRSPYGIEMQLLTFASLFYVFFTQENFSVPTTSFMVIMGPLTTGPRVSIPRDLN